MQQNNHSPAAAGWLSVVFSACFVLAIILVLGIQGSVAAEVGGGETPPSPDRPWAPPHLANYERDLAAEAALIVPGMREAPIEPRKLYDLPALIDLAERTNPETRIAWERARQAAAALGLAESVYFPFLAASAGVGYERAVIPVPSADPGTGQIIGSTLPEDSYQAQTTLSVKWLLLDFGQRDAAVNASKARLLGVNVGFNATHQKIVFEVTRRFYALTDARQQILVAKSALQAAQTVEQAVAARLAQGLATKPELLQAQQETAQCAYDLVAANGTQSDAQVALIESIGIMPTARLHVADSRDAPLPSEPAEPVEALIAKALSQRPDVVAKCANLRASEAKVRQARADYYPKVSMEADAGQSDYRVSMDDSSYNGRNHTLYGAALNVEVPIFDGFARDEKLRAAEAVRRAAAGDLAAARDAAAREVWKAYTDFMTALDKQDAASRLRIAAENAYDAVLHSYKNGLSTYVEVVNAQRNVTAARSVGETTRAAIFTDAAALAWSVGDLAKPEPFPSRRK